MEALTKTNNKSDITHYTHPEFDVTLVKICRCHFVPKPKGYILYDGCKKTFSPMILNRTRAKLATSKNNSSVRFKNVFVWSDDFGDRNICHWFKEQLVNIVFLYDLYRLIPDIKIVVYKNARILRNIKDVLYFIPNFKPESIYEFDLGQTIQAKSLYLGLGKFKSKNNDLPRRIYDFFINTCQYQIVTPSTIYDKVYISRRNTNTNTRILQNVDEISDVIINKGYKEIFVEDLSIQEKISVLHFSQSIVMELGAGCINLCFCRPKTTLFLLFQDNAKNRGFKGSFKHILKPLTVRDITGTTVSRNTNGNAINTPWQLELSKIKDTI